MPREPQARKQAVKEPVKKRIKYLERKKVKGYTTLSFTGTGTRAIESFKRSGFSQEEADELVSVAGLRPSTNLGRQYKSHRLKEVKYYMERGLSWDGAVSLAATLTVELASYAVSPEGAFADALKWNRTFITKVVYVRPHETATNAARRGAANLKDAYTLGGGISEEWTQ